MASHRQSGDRDCRLDPLSRVDHDRQDPESEDRSRAGSTSRSTARQRAERRAWVTVARPGQSPWTPGRTGVGESAAQGTDLADYDTQITCSRGSSVVAEGRGPKVTVTVSRGQSILCAITNTRKAVAAAVNPVLQCVVFRSGAPDQAVWGYSNPNSFPITIPVGATNGFAPAPVNRGQPLVFQPGTVTGAFQTAFAGATTLTWTLGTKTVSAEQQLDPLYRDARAEKGDRPGQRSGDLQPAGQRAAVGERWQRNHHRAGHCRRRRGDGQRGSRPGNRPRQLRLGGLVQPKRRAGGVSPGDEGRRRGRERRRRRLHLHEHPQVNRPADPAGAAAAPATAATVAAATAHPTPPLGDLSVQKTATPTTAVLGHTIRWTITVTNNSTIAAADINLVRVSELTYRLKLVSLTASQGTCNVGACNLGRLAPGASATVTAVTRATGIGRVLNVVRVSSEEQESNYLNNTAAALVRDHRAARGSRGKGGQSRRSQARLQHAHGRAAGASGRQYVDRADNRPQPLRDASPGPGGARGRIRGRPAGANQQPGDRALRAHAHPPEHRPLPARHPAAGRGHVTVSNLPRRARDDDQQAVGHGLSR